MRFHKSAVLAMVLLENHSSVVHGLPQDWTNANSERLDGRHTARAEVSGDVAAPPEVQELTYDEKWARDDDKTIVDGDRDLEQRSIPDLPPDLDHLLKWLGAGVVVCGTMVGITYSGYKMWMRFTSEDQRNQLYDCMARNLPFINSREQARDRMHDLESAGAVVMEVLPSSVGGRDLEKYECSEKSE